MLQWMGGAQRKMKAAKNSKLKRQREYFDHRKEKQRKMELGEETGMHTLADYIRQNLHGGESLDILGLRSLTPTPVDVNTAADSDASPPDPATAAVRPNSGDAGGVPPTTSNASASSGGILKGDAQDTTSQQPECKTGIIHDPEQEIMSCSQRTQGVAAAAQQEIKILVNQNTEIPVPGKGRNPIHVGNLQTKKVASSPRLKLLDMISDDNKDENRGLKRLPTEAYAIFSQDGNDAIKDNIFDQGVLHPQQTFITSDSVADWAGTKHLLDSSLQLTNSCDSCPETRTSDLLSRFLSTQKLKSFKGKSWRQRQEHNVTKDHLSGAESILNSFRVTHNGGDDLYFSDPTVHMTNAQAKEPRKINFSKSLFDMEYFHVKQGPKEFDISDPFGNTMNTQMKQPGRQKYGYLNPGFNIDDLQVTREYPFLADLSFDWSAFKVDSNFFDQKKGSCSPENDPINWNNDISLTLPDFMREFRTLDYMWSVQVPSYDRAQNSSLQFGTNDKFPDMIEDFYPNLENREISDVMFDRLLLPLDGFEVERQHVEADFSSCDDVSSKRMRTNQSNFENETLDWNDDGRKKCSFSEEWICELSASQDVPWHQENNDPAYSGGDSDQTHNPNGANSWSQTVDGGTADHLYAHTFNLMCFGVIYLLFALGFVGNHLRDWSTDYLASDMGAIQGRVLPYETQATIAPETRQDRKPLFLPQINNGDEDFIIVCFPDKEDCRTVDANTFQLPIQPINIPLQVLGTEESPSEMEHDINVLSYKTPFNRISQEIDDFCVSGKDISAAEATTTTHNTLRLARESSDCDRILTSSHRFQLDYPLPYSDSSIGKGTEVMSRHVKETQREAFSELQSPTTRRSFSDFLAKQGETIEDGLEPHSSSCYRADQCLSSNVLYDHASRPEMTHNVEDNSMEVCTPLRKPLQEDMNGMSTTKAEGMPRKQQWKEDGITHDNGCRASFSSQEECSPACQLDTVQAVLCKLQRPAFSCGSKQGRFPEKGIKNVDTVLLKLQRPTRNSIHGLGLQNAQANPTMQKDMKQTSDMNQKSNLESEIKTTTVCQTRLLTYHNTSGSRGSLPLPNASKTVILSSKGGEDKRELSEISTLRNKESKLSLDDIDAIASTDHRFSNQPYQRSNQSKAHSLPFLERIKEVADSSVPRAGDAKQYSTPVSQRNPVSEVPEQPSRRDSDPPVSHTGRLESPSNTPQGSGGQEVIKASEGQEGLQDNQHTLPDTETHFQRGGNPTNSDDAASVKMLGGLQDNQHNLPDTETHFQQGGNPTNSDDAASVKMLGGLQDNQHNLPDTETHFQQGGNPTNSDDAASVKMLGGLQDNQHNKLVTEKHFQQSKKPTTSYDADYVKMLESYVVQLKLENNMLRLWTGS